MFKVFKHQEAEEEKEHMRNNFSVINLERVRFELKKHAKESYPYRIAFYTKKSPTTLVFDEYFLSLELAEQRMEYLKNFKGKKTMEIFGMTVLITKQIELSLQQEHEIIEI